MIQDDPAIMMELQGAYEIFYKKMEEFEFECHSVDGLIKITSNALPQIVELHIAQELLQPDRKKSLEEALVSLINETVKLAREHQRKQLERATETMRPERPKIKLNT